jgi:beta-N-acetylhexosaminidase
MKVPRRPLRFPLGAASFALISVAACTTGTPPPPPISPVEVPPPVAEVEHADSLAEVIGEEPTEVQPDPALLPPPPFGYWADSVLSSLSLEEKAGQLIMPWMLGDFAPEGSAGIRRILELVEGLGVGGVIVSVGSPSEVAVKLNELQSRARVPLLMAADLETGAGFRFRGAAYLPGPIPLGGATEFPSLMALGAAGDPDLAHEMGRITGVEARALGVHVPFAPVLDVNNNPVNPIINVRSFGEDPAEVARLGTAFVKGVQDGGALATGKHFPGHGDTETDSHLDLPVITVSRERLDSVELPPFRAAIDGGIAGIMTAHIAVPALTGASGVPSTLSRAVLTSLLREEMGFQGLVFTDAMDMYAIDRRHSRGEAAVRAIEAGADVILMPPDPLAAVNGIVGAVREGRLQEERLDASVRRLLEAKETVGLHRGRMVPVQEVSRVVGIRAHEEAAQEAANRSITLLKNERSLLPLLGTRTAQVLSVTFRRTTDLMAGRVFNDGLRARYPRLLTADLDRNTPGDVYASLLQRARSSNMVVVSLYVTAVSYSGSVAIPDQTADFIRRLAREGVPHVVISFGNPYLLSEFPDVRAYLLAWSGADVSQRAAAWALFGDIPIQGRTPTRIPPFFQVGDGVQLPARQGTRDD